MTLATRGTLPSSRAAVALVDGEPGALGDVVISTVGRAAILAAGLYVAGFRGRELARGAVAGALAIEAFVIWYAWRERDNPPADVVA